jgi:hypothetical protein
MTMGSLKLRGRIWWIKYYPNGVAQEESSRSEKKKVAIDLLRLREGDITNGVPVSAKVGRLRFDDAVADVVKDYKVNGRSTTDAVERRIRLHLAPFFGGRRMATIDTYSSAPTSRSDSRRWCRRMERLWPARRTRRSTASWRS